MTTKNRYWDAATVSDEHGKGAEILRSHGTRIGANGTHVIMVAEVDMLIREVKVATSGTAPTGGTIRILKRPAGGADATVVNITEAEAIPTDSWANSELDLDAERDVVRKGDVVYVTVAAFTPAAAELYVQLGWMPDLWRPGADHRTY